MSDLPQGTIVRAIDKAGRVVVRGYIGERHGAVVMTYGLDGQILMMEPPAWDAFKARLLALNPLDIDVQDLRRFQIAPAQGCPIDSAGRARVPEALRGYAKLDADDAQAQLLDLGGGELEVWSVEKYNAYLGERSAELKQTMRRYAQAALATEQPAVAPASA